MSAAAVLENFEVTSHSDLMGQLVVIGQPQALFKDLSKVPKTREHFKVRILEYQGIWLAYSSTEQFATNTARQGLHICIKTSFKMAAGQRDEIVFQF